MTKSNKAFTLAEVLVTLGIIGIVAAMTMPMLFGKVTRIKNQALLKEDYAILANMRKRALDDGKLGSGVSFGNNMGKMKQWFQESIQPYIKTVNVCYDEPGCYSGKDTLLNGRSMNFEEGTCGGNTIAFTIPNGSAVCIEDYSNPAVIRSFGYESEDPVLVFYVDVNGVSPPNVYGKDIFILLYDNIDDNFVPAGHSLTDAEVNDNCRLGGNGKFCASWAKRNSWRLPDF